MRAGGFFHQLGILPGTIIADINCRTVNNMADINEALMVDRNSSVQTYNPISVESFVTCLLLPIFKTGLKYF